MTETMTAAESVLLHEDGPCHDPDKHPRGVIPDDQLFAGWMMPDFVIDRNGVVWCARGNDFWDSYENRDEYFDYRRLQNIVPNATTFCYRDGTPSVSTVGGIEIVTGLGDRYNGTWHGGICLERNINDLKLDLTPCDIVLYQGKDYERDGEVYRNIDDETDVLTEEDARRHQCVRVYRGDRLQWRNSKGVVSGVGSLPARDVRDFVRRYFAEVLQPSAMSSPSQHVVATLYGLHEQTGNHTCRECDQPYPCSTIHTIRTVLDEHTIWPQEALSPC